MEDNFATEISKCFKKQYPEKEKAYTGLLHGNYDGVIEGIKIYDDMMENLTFMIELIMKLKRTK